jgi:hypothetical protein
MTVAVIVTAVLMTRSSAVLAAGTHYESVRRRSDVAASSYADPTLLAILPPPDEPPPPPPPGEGSPAGDFESWRNMDGFDAEGPRAERVLELPQVPSLHRGLVLTHNREHRANPSRGVD